jgi:LysR family transcriptional regulator, glycine cleavage system transcriptional activator
MPMNEKPMDKLPLEWVRVFEAAGRTGSFTAAAAEVGLTQAAVSQRIQNLEQRIGARLFTRQARGVTLTVEGEAWLPYVGGALRSLNRSADELFGKPLQKLVLSASASVIQLWIVPRLAALDLGAQSQLSLTTMNIEPDFANIHADIEIRYGSGAWPGRVGARLYPEVLTPMATPALLRGAARWQELPRIAVSGPRPGWQEWAERSGDTAQPAPRYRFDSFVAALSAARAGLGVMLGSVPLCGPALADGSLVALSTDTLVRDDGYWMTAREDAVPARQWKALVAGLCA